MLYTYAYTQEAVENVSKGYSYTTTKAWEVKRKSFLPNLIVNIVSNTNKRIIYKQQFKYEKIK